MLSTIYRTFLFCTLPYLLQAQFVINSPKARSVLQRDAANRAQLTIAGTAPRSASAIEARLIPMVLGQGTPINWTPVATVNPDRTFRGTLAALGGWYRVEIRAKAATTVVADTAVSRVGVGEVFVLAGQSNAQGVPQAIAPAAVDDRVSCVDVFQRDQIDAQVFPFMFSHVSAGTSIGPSNWPYLWSILGDSLVKRLNVPVLFLGAAQGGSNSTEWKYGAAATPNTVPYLRVSAVLLNYVSRLGMRAVLWHQGESDVNVAEQTYFDNLSYVINKSRQQLNYGRLAWLVSRASYIYGATNSNVISAQNRLSAEIADVYPGPATDGLTGSDNRADDVHFSGQGLVRAASLWNQRLTDLFFSQSAPFIPAADTIRTDAGWQPITTGTPFSSLQRVGYRYESASHVFSLLIGATAPVEGRIEQLDGTAFVDNYWTTLPPIAATGNTDPGFSDYDYVRFYLPISPGVAGVPPGRYRLSVRPVGDTGLGYQLETILHDYRNTLFIGNDRTPPPPVIQQADLRIGMQTNRRVVPVGQPITHQLMIVNKGPQAATGVRLQSRLPPGLTFLDSPQSTVTAQNGVVTALFDTLPPYTTKLIFVRTAPTAAGQYITAAQLVASNQFDPNSQPGTGTADGEDDMALIDFRTNDSLIVRHESANAGGRILPTVQSSQPTPVPAKADLSLALQMGRTVAASGTSLTIVCAITNGGGMDASHVNAQVVLPAGWRLLSPATFTSSGQTLTGPLVSIPAGTTALLPFVVSVGPTTSRAQLIAQIAHADQTDPDSTAGNGYNRGEDDEASATVRVP